jgi:two-component system, OmpR family, alkaline phosphatase synthesis response regulator PhoP
MPRILIVEDDRDIALGLEEDLARHGYEVATVGDGEKAIQSGKENVWDLIILDLMLPRKDGFEVCQQLRFAGVKTSIIMLTAKTHEAEKVLGLELGADDYVTKPFSPRELRARIHAVLRRVTEESRSTHRFGDCKVDFDRGEVRRTGTPIDVSALEFRLLAAFIRQRGRVLSRDQLIDAVWGQGTFVTDRVVDARPEPAQEDRAGSGEALLHPQRARHGLSI